MGFYSDKVVIITGAGSGIGQALAEELARQNAILVLSDINTERLTKVTESIVETGCKAEAVPLDVTDYEAVKKMVDEAVEKHGRLDYIFNNAGIAVGGEVRDCTIDDWRRVLDVNLYGVVNGVDAAYPLMVRQGFGHIVNTGSIEGLVPFTATVSYVTSKHAVVGLSSALRIEGADLGVKVSVVCPGFIDTAIFKDSKMIKMDHEKVLEAVDELKGASSEQCAKVILRGVQRNKAIILVTGMARRLWAFQRISPGFVRWLMGLGLKRSRKEVRIE